MKMGSRMPATGESLLTPRALAADATIGGGLNPPSMRLAIVLAAQAFFGHSGQWSVTKPELQKRVDVVLDNAARLLEPLREAVLERGEQTAPLFDVVDYEPGSRHRTAGMITVRLSYLAREMLYSRQETVKVPLDEFRLYSTISGIMLRLRLAARMQGTKTMAVDHWRFEPETFSGTDAFGSIASTATIKRTNVRGEAVEYTSLSRAAQVLLEKGVKEINVRSQAVSVELVPLKTGTGDRAKWIAVDIITKRIHKPKPATKPKMSDLNRRQRQPAIVR